MINLHSYPDAKIALSVPIVPNLGNNTNLGTHFSHGGIGGYVEVPTIQDLYDIPSIAAVDSSINPDGLTSGRRKLGMLVYVIEENKFYQLRPKYKDTKKVIPWEVLNAIPDILRGFFLNSSAFKYIFTGIVWSELETLLSSNPDITPEDISSLKEYALYGDISDASSIQDDVIIGTGDVDLGLPVYGDVPTPADSWIEVSIGSGGAGAGEIFQNDITVSLSSGKTFGKYVAGGIIPAKDKTPKEVILMACFEALPPVLDISSASILEFGSEGSVDVDLNCSFAINSLNSSVSSIKIERKKGSGNWVEIFSATTSSQIFFKKDTFNHVKYDTESIFYKLTVEDTAGGINQKTYEFEPSPYIPPNILLPSVGATDRYRGDSSTTYTGSITKRSNLVPILSYKLQRKIGNSATWSDLNSFNITGDPSSISVNTSETDPGNVSIKNADSITYQVVVIDEYTQSISSETALGAKTINFYHKCGVLYSSSATINVTNIDNAAGMVLQDTKARTITGVSANGMYTYYVYKSSAGALANIVQDDALSVKSTWIQQANIDSTNSNGATVSYAVYRSSVPGAYTNKKLAFT